MGDKKLYNINFINQTNFYLFFIFIVFVVLSFNNFLLFHSLVEIFSVIISFIIFIIAIYTYDKINNNFLIIIGIAYGFIGFFDLMHTFSYKGMNIFINSGANLPTQLWIIGRYLESFIILIALMFLGSKIKCDRNKITYSLFIVSGLIILSLYHNVFPIAYIEGKGLTTFKIISEYVISGILLISLYLLFNKKNFFEKSIYKFVFISIVMTIISEIAFTFYIDVYGISNIVGHIFKVISVILIFKAIVESGFKRPYDLLYKEIKSKSDQLSEEKRFISSIYNNIEQGICVHELIYNDNNEPIDYKIIDANNAYQEILDIPIEKALESLGSEIYFNKRAPYLDIYADAVKQKKTIKMEEYYDPMNKYFSITVTPFKDKQFITLFEDITNLKENEIELKKKYQEVQKLNNELGKLIYLTNRLSITLNLKIDEFLKDVLEIAMDLINIADYGSISIFKKNNWEVIDSYNYDQELINNLNHKRDLIYEGDKNVFKVDLIKMNNKQLLKEIDENNYSIEIISYLNELSEKIKESIFFELNYENNKKIRVSLDISSKSKKGFNKNDEIILKALRNIVYVFLNMKFKIKEKTNNTKDDIFQD